MRKPQILMAGLVVAAIIFTGSIRAAGAAGNPFNALWNAVHELQDQVADLTGGGTDDPVIDRTKTYAVSTDVAIVAGNVGTGMAACHDANDVLLSGGFDSTSQDLDTYRSAPFLDVANQTWAANAMNNGTETETLTIKAVCLMVE